MMGSLIEDAGKYVIGALLAASLLIVIDWINSPGETELRTMMGRESPWVQERLLVLSRIEGMEREDAALAVRIEANASKIDSIHVKIESEIRTLQGKMESELRAMQNSLYRILARLEIEETKKKEEEDPTQ
jgi:hypothetical protein